MSADIRADFEALRQAVHNESLRTPLPMIITTRATKARYEAMLQELSRQRHVAAYDWTHLHWWQWRKRRRLYRKLFGIGGWRVEPLPHIPERVTRCGRFIKRYREGGC